MSETWFKTNRWDLEIQPVEVVKVSEKSVTVREEKWHIGSANHPKEYVDRRRSKWSDYDKFFPSWEEAHTHLLRRAEHRLESARRELAAAQGHYGNVKGMKPPKSPVA